MPVPQTIRISHRRVKASESWARLTMAWGAARLAVNREPGSKALRSAILATTANRIPVRDRLWCERIEAARSALRSDEMPSESNFDAAELPSWALPISEPIHPYAAAVTFGTPPAWGRLLMRLVRELRPATVLELGTGVGISTAYQAAALELNGEGRLVSLDVGREFSKTANALLRGLDLADRVDLEFGMIDATLPAVLKRLGSVDLAFVDAEHEGQPTLSHLETMLPWLADDAVVVFDDIEFSASMRAAWGEIRRHPSVSKALALGRMGVVSTP